MEHLREGSINLPVERHPEQYSRDHGVMAAVDLMLTVVDGNRPVHGTWTQLVIFSAILSKNYAEVLASPSASRKYRDETMAVPAELRMRVRASTIASLLTLPETTVRRHVKHMIRDGRLEWSADGLEISKAWLNQPHCVDVSRQTEGNVMRILGQLAAHNFPFNYPLSVNLNDQCVG